MPADSKNSFGLTVAFTKESKSYVNQLMSLVGRDNFYRLLDPLMSRQALRAAGVISKTQLSGQLLRRRTGSLARSMTGVGLRDRGVPAMKIGILRGPALKYAGVLDEGTVGKGGKLPTIVPKSGKALAFPVDAALTPAGVDRYGGPRNYPGALKFIPYRKSGVAIGALYDAADLAKELKRAKKEARLVSLTNVKRLYVLLRRLDIAPTHFLQRGFDQYLPEFSQALADYLKKVLTQVESKLA